MMAILKMAIMMKIPARPSLAPIVLGLCAALAGLGLAPGAGAAEDAAKCKLNPLGSMPITFSGYALKPTIKGSINDVPTQALLDISSAETSLNKTVLDHIGVDVRDTRLRSAGIGNERAIVYQAHVRQLQVGPSKGAGNFEAWDTGDVEYGIRVGTNFLLKFDTEISLADKHVRFFRPEGCKNIAPIYWEGASTSVPFWVENGDDLRPHFKVKINGKEIDAILSTSTEDSMLDLGAAKYIGITEQSPVARKAGQIQTGAAEILDTWIVPIDTLDIGGERVNKLKVRMTDLGAASRGIILGLDFLRAHRIFISMSQRQLYLTYLGGKLFNVDDEGEQPWFLSEAEKGNADAQYRMSLRYDGRDRSPADRAKGREWLAKAAAQGNQAALTRVAKSEFLAALFANSAQHFAQLRHDNTRLPGDIAWTYLANARGGDPFKALQQLKAERPDNEVKVWEDNLLDFHLGLIDAATLMKRAGKDDRKALRLCEASFHVAEAALIAGKFEQADGALKAVAPACHAGAWEQAIATAELARLKAASPRS